MNNDSYLADALDDDNLLQLVGSILGEASLSVTHTADTADLAWQCRDPDAAIAELVHDSLAAAGLRSGVGTDDRVVEFSSGDVQIEVFISPNGRNLSTVNLTARRISTGDDVDVTVRCIDARGHNISLDLRTRDAGITFDVAPGMHFSAQALDGATPLFDTPWTRL
jgi:hypothetical protein